MVEPAVDSISLYLSSIIPCTITLTLYLLHLRGRNIQWFKNDKSETKTSSAGTQQSVENDPSLDQRNDGKKCVEDKNSRPKDFAFQQDSEEFLVLVAIYANNPPLYLQQVLHEVCAQGGEDFACTVLGLLI